MKSLNYNFVSIEGNIGSGKTTLLKLLREKFKEIQYVAEPVEEWQCINGDQNLNILHEFYSDPKRWAYTMQTLEIGCGKVTSILSIFSLKEKGDSKMILSERSIAADKQIFAVNGYKDGLINELEFALYNQFYDWLVDEVFQNQGKNQIKIYLRVDPNVCHLRLQKRGRSEEKNSVSLEYLEQIHQRHEEWLYLKDCNDDNVLCLDGNPDFENNPEKQNEIFNQITQFLEKIHGQKLI